MNFLKIKSIGNNIQLVSPENIKILDSFITFVCLLTYPSTEMPLSDVSSLGKWVNSGLEFLILLSTLAIPV